MASVVNGKIVFVVTNLATCLTYLCEINFLMKIFMASSSTLCTINTHDLMPFFMLNTLLIIFIFIFFEKIVLSFQHTYLMYKTFA